MRDLSTSMWDMTQSEEIFWGRCSDDWTRHSHMWYMLPSCETILRRSIFSFKCETTLHQMRDSTPSNVRQYSVGVLSLSNVRLDTVGKDLRRRCADERRSSLDVHVHSTRIYMWDVTLSYLARESRAKIFVLEGRMSHVTHMNESCLRSGLISNCNVNEPWLNFVLSFLIFLARHDVPFN